MELNQFFYIIRKRLVFIVVIPVLAAFAAAVASLYYLTPLYQSSSTLYIVSQKSSASVLSYEEILANEHLVKDYRELIKSRLITKAAIEELHITDITPAELSDNITVTSKNDTKVLLVTVKDKDPERAKNLTDKICEVFINKSLELINVNNISVVDTAERNDSPVYPKPLLYITIAFILSLSATICIIYFLEITNETIQTSEDIETYLGLNVLGTIPSFKIK
ncbi:capsular polysaccharide biosynthesis protein [Ruminiclostridium sufflavum DSM 19573]|uniref:Capsular polysaccharide biosynthesis protein n=1 Tax=Ruminiclostridium sufflavum DSM 19573 TaxID=1121337 RepID=A0A318XPV0_9FIRM|nr:Wzz/FepE/Etk N-terminal domain-containing protein [Ruminiclostridium sufflavum]PYG87785.1 capsular polysaccharide biosynthesis protein [Ruminiclostridium sufflavum DSM 19573]